MMVQFICKALRQIAMVSWPSILDLGPPFYPGPSYPHDFLAVMATLLVPSLMRLLNH